MTQFKFVVGGGLNGGEIWATDWHFETPAIPPLGARDAVVVAGVFLDSLWIGAAGGSPGIGSIMAASTTLTGCTIYVLDPTTGRALDRAFVARNLPGTGAGGATPNQCAVVATLKTATPGPRGRGRVYLPPPLLGAVTLTGRLIATHRDQMANTVGKTLLLMQTSGYNPVLFTKSQPNRPITTGSVGDVIDTQRRRRDKLVEARSSDVPATTLDSVSVLL